MHINKNSRGTSAQRVGNDRRVVALLNPRSELPRPSKRRGYPGALVVEGRRLKFAAAYRAHERAIASDGLPPKYMHATARNLALYVRTLQRAK